MPIDKATEVTVKAYGGSFYDTAWRHWWRAWMQYHAVKRCRCKDHSGHGLSQWETTLNCNVTSHWLSPCHEWCRWPSDLHGKKICSGINLGMGLANQCPVKLFVGLHEVRGQPRFETRSLYHFMFKGEGGVVHGKMASAHFMWVTLLGNPYVNKQLICFRFKKNIRYSTTEYNLLSHLLFYTNVFYIFGLSHCEKPVYY